MMCFSVHVCFLVSVHADAPVSAQVVVAPVRVKNASCIHTIRTRLVTGERADARASHRTHESVNSVVSIWHGLSRNFLQS